MLPTDDLVQRVDADQAQHHLQPVAAVDEHQSGQWQCQVEKHFIGQRPGDVGYQHAGVSVLVDVRAVERQPRKHLLEQFQPRLFQLPALQVEDRDEHQQHQWQVQRVQAEHPRNAERQPVVVAALREQAAPEQEPGDHEEQRDAALASIE